MNYKTIRDGKRNIYEFELEFLRETAAAILVSDGDMNYWLPKSQLESDWDGAEIGELVEVAIPEWLAIKLDMI